MRIKIIGECESARALRSMLRQAGFAVTEFLPADAVLHGPQAGYVITIEETESSGWVHFDSVDCPLERRVLQHVTVLSPHPVSLDRPGGEVHSERELRILVPKGDPAQATAVEFGVLRGLLELTEPKTAGTPELRFAGSDGSQRSPDTAPEPARISPPVREPWYSRFFL